MTDYQTEIDDLRVEIEAIEQLQDEIKTAESIGATRLSGLFHKARTASNHWKTATAFCGVEDGDVVVRSLAKLSGGRWSPDTRKRHDLVINVPTRPFMDTTVFRRAVEDELRKAVMGRENTIRNLDAQRRHEQHREA